MTLNKGRNKYSIDNVAKLSKTMIKTKQVGVSCLEYLHIHNNCENTK